MINKELIHPSSIAVVGASEDTAKPGGKILENLLTGGFDGDIYPVNPKSKTIQGLQAFPDVSAINQADLAILAIPARFTIDVVDVLLREKGTRAFIIVSAGFGELNEEGAMTERKLARMIGEAGGCLIGPNCIGVMNRSYAGVFTTPVPERVPHGVALISGSGATAVFILEMGLSRGMTFSSVYSMGNSAQNGVEEVVAWMDTHDEHPGALLLYLESIRNPGKLLYHSASLIKKGIPIVALKAGITEAGSRAASSHTGAMAGSDQAADALFQKAGIIRCYSREEMIAVASVLMQPKPRGKNFAVVTHAGGPGVMLTDTLTQQGLRVPEIEGPAADTLLQKLHPGSTVHNPIDFLATGTAEQLESILDAVETDFNQIDASVVIFGSPGLFPVDHVYDVIHRKIRSSAKPIFPVLPSVINVRKDIEAFIARGHAYFPDEVSAGNALGRVMNAHEPFYVPEADKKKPNPEMTKLVSGISNEYLPPELGDKILRMAGIDTVRQCVTEDFETLKEFAGKSGFPLVLKASGLLHKSDQGGVITGIQDEVALRSAFDRLLSIPSVTSVMVQPMLQGLELFAGVKREDPYGHLILFGIGGIYVEVWKDFSLALAPVSEKEARYMIRKLKSYPLIRGIRGKQGVDEDVLVRIIMALSSLVKQLPDIEEMDINPFMASGRNVLAVDTRIRVRQHV